MRLKQKLNDNDKMFVSDSVTINYSELGKIVSNLKKDQDEIENIIKKLDYLIKDEKSFLGKAENQAHERLVGYKQRYQQSKTEIENTKNLITEYLKNQSLCIPPTNYENTIGVQGISSFGSNEIFEKVINKLENDITNIKNVIENSAFEDNEIFKNPNYDPNSTMNPWAQIETYTTQDSIEKDPHKIEQQRQNLRLLKEVKEKIQTSKSNIKNSWNFIENINNQKVGPFIQADKNLWAQNFKTWYKDHDLEAVYEAGNVVYNVALGIFQGTVGDLIDTTSSITQLMELYWINQNGTPEEKERYKVQLEMSKTFFEKLAEVGKKLGKDFIANPLLATTNIITDVLKSISATWDDDVKKHGYVYALSHTLTTLIGTGKVLAIGSKTKLAIRLEESISRFAKVKKTFDKMKKYTNPEELIIASYKSLSSDKAAELIMSKLSPSVTWEEFSQSNLYARYKAIFDPGQAIKDKLKTAKDSFLNKKMFEKIMESKKRFNDLIEKNAVTKTAKNAGKELLSDGLKKLAPRKIADYEYKQMQKEKNENKK